GEDPQAEGRPGGVSGRPQGRGEGRRRRSPGVLRTADAHLPWPARGDRRPRGEARSPNCDARRRRPHAPTPATDGARSDAEGGEGDPGEGAAGTPGLWW